MSYELKEYLNSINFTKQNLMDGDDEMYEKKYSSFIVNKCLAPHNDCVLLVNEMNKHGSTLVNDKKLQYDFLLNTIRPKNRFAPWVRGSKIKDLEFIKEYYGYSNEKAKVALQILSNDQIKTIKDSLSKGGRK